MIKKIKIFHIIGSMEIIAGTENFLINLLNENNSRYENYLILLKKKNDLKNRLKKNIKIKTFELDNPISFFINFTKLIIFLFKKKPKIIYSWLYHANFVTLFLRPIFKGKKILWNIRHSKIDRFHSIKSYISFKFCEKISSFIPNKIIYNSYTAKEMHEKSGYNKSKSLVILNGVKKNRLIKSRFKNKIYLGMASRWHKDKNHFNFFSAIKKINDNKLYLILCGKNIEKKNYQLISMIKKLGIKNYLLLGELREMKKYFSKIDINCLTSNTESLPNIILESMSYGIPSIATNVGDIKKIMMKTGEVVPPNNSNALLKALRKLIKERNNSSKKWNLRKKKCYYIAQNHFNFQKVVIKFNKFV